MAVRTDTTDDPGLYTAGRTGIRRSVLLLAGRALLGAAGAVLIGSLIDGVAAGRAVTAEMWWLTALLAGAALLGWRWPLLANQTRSVIESDLEVRILDAVIRRPTSRYRAGEVAHRATEGVAAVGDLAGRFLPQLFGGIAIPLLICGVVAIIDVPSALVLLITVPAIPLLLRGMEARFTSVTRRYNETADRLTAQFFDGIQGMKTLRALDASEEYGRRLAEESEQLRSETMVLLRVNQLALLIVDSLFTLGTVVAAGSVALWRLQEGAISLGQAVAIVLLGVALIEPISQIGRFFYVGAVGRAAAKDIKMFLGHFGGESAFEPRAGEGAWIRFEDVSFAYEDDNPVLDSVSFQVEPGETVGLVGASGAGKSTIAALVTGLRGPDEGRVEVGGRVAVVSQQPFLFHGTLRENLLLAHTEATDDDLWSALEAADLAGVGDSRGGLDLEVGERGLRLSGGEAQRLTIARLILADAPIVVLDEPTSNVDIETENRVRRALDRLMAGRTVIVIAHRQSTLTGVDRVISVGEGAVTEETASR